MTTYLVSAKHKVAKYNFTDTPVRVDEDSYYHTFYASHPELGMGKNYRTARDAIYGLFQAHACYDIRIAEKD